MKIFYFAWLKEHTGCSYDDMPLPDGVETVGALIPYITRQSPGHKTALANLEAVRVAVKRLYSWKGKGADRFGPWIGGQQGVDRVCQPVAMQTQCQLAAGGVIPLGREAAIQSQHNAASVGNPQGGLDHSRLRAKRHAIKWGLQFFDAKRA